MKTERKIINFILVLVIGFVALSFLRCRNSPSINSNPDIELNGHAKLAQQDQTDVTKIDTVVASRLHTNYVKSNCMVNTKRVVFDFTKFKEISDTILKKKDIKAEALVFITYFGRYDGDDGVDLDSIPLEGRNTVIINFATINDQGKVVPMADEIWNFGDTRPPKAGEIDIVRVKP